MVTETRVRNCLLQSENEKLEFMGHSLAQSEAFFFVLLGKDPFLEEDLRTFGLKSEELLRNLAGTAIDLEALAETQDERQKLIGFRTQVEDIFKRRKEIGGRSELSPADKTTMGSMLTAIRGYKGDVAVKRVEVVTDCINS